MSWRRLIARWAVPIGTVLLLASSSAVGASDPVNLQLDPGQIEIGIFYHGADVQVQADVPSCHGAVLVMEAGAEETTFNRKGRKAGIWLSVGKVTISGVPKVYLMGSSRNLDSLCSIQTQRALGLGIASLRDRMKISSDGPLSGDEVDEFLKLKTETGTYGTTIPVSLKSMSGDREELTAILAIPASVPPGDYEVRLYCFSNGGLIQQATSTINIKRVGLADLLASLAHKRAATYGISAILIAMLVGIVMGMVFHSRPGSGH